MTTQNQLGEVYVRAYLATGATPEELVKAVAKMLAAAVLAGEETANGPLTNLTRNWDMVLPGEESEGAKEISISLSMSDVRYDA